MVDLNGFLREIREREDRYVGEILVTVEDWKFLCIHSIFTFDTENDSKAHFEIKAHALGRNEVCWHPGFKSLYGPVTPAMKEQVRRLLDGESERIPHDP